MPLFFLAVLQTAADLPAMKYSKVGEDHIFVLEPFDQSLGSVVEGEIARRAASICAGKTIRWGEFKFDQNLGKDPVADPSRVESYRREFSCVAADSRTYLAVPVEWTASIKDEADVRAFFSTYYTKRDGGDFPGAQAMMRPETRSELVAWGDQMRQLNKQLGKGNRRLTKVTWYVNPEGADRPGAYAALDFIGSYTGTHVYCGYIVLYRLGPASYEIVREEQNSFNRSAEAPNPDHLAAMRTAVCRE